MNNDTITCYPGNQLTGSRYSLLTEPDTKQVPIRKRINLQERTDTIINKENYVNGQAEILKETLVAGDYLEFISQPLEEACDINASFLAHLNMIVNKKDMDVAINL